MAYSKYIKVGPRKRRPEIFPKPIPGFENYLADSSGKIYTTDRFGRLKQLTQFLSPNSRYLRVCLSRNSKRKNIYVHNLVLSAYRNYNPEKISVKHLDRNRFNNNLRNLKLGGIVTFDRQKKTDEYRIGCLEEIFRDKAGYDTETDIWKRYLKVKRKGTPRTVINWLGIVLKNL